VLTAKLILDLPEDRLKQLEPLARAFGTTASALCEKHVAFQGLTELVVAASRQSPETEFPKCVPRSTNQ
jgi:hypothetical protein